VLGQGYAMWHCQYGVAVVVLMICYYEVSLFYIRDDKNTRVTSRQDITDL